MQPLSAHSPAKINLTLRVGPRRDDGYHDIESLVAHVGLFDDITINGRDDDRFTVECNDGSIPADESNLAIRAARRLAEAAGKVACGVHIQLVKRIPAGAGLGGGSSNAATVLSVLNRLWQLRLSPGRLAEIGVDIGSDVPLFLHGPLSVMRGRGERVEPIRASLVSAVVLVVPRIHSATPDVYRAFDSLPMPPEREAIAQTLGRVMQSNLSFPGGPAQIQGPHLIPHLFNDLQPAACRANPALGDFADRLAQTTNVAFSMTGSGSGFFRLFDKYTDRRYFAELRDRIVSEFGDVHVVQTFVQT